MTILRKRLVRFPSLPFLAIVAFVLSGCDPALPNSPPAATAPASVVVTPVDPVASDPARRLDQIRAERMALMPAVALWKWIEKKPIEDRARESIVLDDVERSATARGFDGSAARGFFEELMTEAKKGQTELHERWSRSPPDTTKAPDIAAIRKEIDRLTPLLIDAWAAANRK